MRVDLLSPPELSAADRAMWVAWQRADARLASPFVSPSFVERAYEVRPRVRVAAVSEGGRRVGFWPLSLDRFGAAVPVMPGWTDCQGMVHAPGWAWDWTDILAAARLPGWRFDHLVAHQVPRQVQPGAIAFSPTIDLSGGWEAYDHWLRREHKRLIQRKRTSFRKAERNYRVTFAEDDGAADALPALIRMKSAQCRSRGWVDLFQDAHAADLVSRAARNHEDDMTGLISTIRFDDEIAAAALFLDSGHSRALWITAFDAKWSAYSPGIMLMLKAAEAAAARGLRHLSLGKGEEEYKLALSQDAEPLASGTLRGPGHTGRLFAVRATPTRAVESLFASSPATEAAVRRAVRRARRVAYHRHHPPTPHVQPS